MDREIEKILESIEIDEKGAWLFELRQRLLTASDVEAKQIVEEMSLRGESHFVGSDRFKYQPYYYLFEASAHEILQERDKAINSASRAIFLFRMQNLQWNEALAHWFLGILYQKYDRKEESCKELQAATAILEGIAKGFQQRGRVADCLTCQNVLRQLYRHISLLKSEVDLIAASGQDHNAYLLPNWMPVYEQVQQHDEEIISWAGPSGGVETEIQLIIIGERWYSIKSARRNHGKILLDCSKEYGWAKIRGNDMNAAQPTPIEDGDYVLFIKQGEIGEDDLVVASRWRDQQKEEYSYMVRKLGKKIRSDNMLYSESSEIADRYKPVPVDGDVQILGYVIAVAKPVKTHDIETTLVVEQSDELPPNQKLTPEFLAKVLTPYLNEIDHIQKLFCEVSNQSPREIEIKVIRQFSPFSIGLDGLLQSTIELIRMTKKWRMENEKALAKCAERQAELDIKLKELDLKLKEEEVETRKLENKRLYLEIDEQEKKLRRSLKTEVIAILSPNLSDDQHAQVETLVPYLYAVASSPLEIKNIGGKISQNYQLKERASKPSDFVHEKHQAQTLSPKEEELYRTLLSMVGHDDGIVERLVRHEYRLAPKANREELLNNAVQRLLHDRHAH